MNKGFDDDTYVEIVDDDKPIGARILEKIETNEDGTCNPFFIGDLGDIIKKHKAWKRCFPRVEPFYAVKCNDLYPVLRTLANMGLSFDCASQNEIEKILNLGVHPSRIIYANSVKQPSFIRFAANNGVTLMTFDNEEELHKIKAIYSDARIVLRILPPSNYNVKYNLGKKFGCNPKLERHLLEVARRLGLNVVGVSFHVGSGCLESDAFETAIHQARNVFDIGTLMGFQMKILDIGGGIPGQEMPNFSFEEMAAAVSTSLNKHFPDNEDLRIIAEPGQYYVASSFTFAANIIGKRTDDGEDHTNDCKPNSTSNKCVMVYYINDGIYGNYNTAFTDPGCFVPSHFKGKTDNIYNSMIWGPTCDALDLVIQDIQLPELNVGEWIYFKDMGAYTVTTTSNFNNMQPAKQFYICEKKLWEELYEDKMKVGK